MRVRLLLLLMPHRVISGRDWYRRAFMRLTYRPARDRDDFGMLQLPTVTPAQIEMIRDWWDE